MTTEPNLPDPVSAIATLDEPKRRQLYDYVVVAPRGRRSRRGGRGIRDEPRARVVPPGPARGRRPARSRSSGASTAGADRAPVARPSSIGDRRVDVVATFPTRRYERAAAMFAEALERLGGRSGCRCDRGLTDVARARGQAAGADARHRAGSRPGRRRMRTVLLELLTGAGYEPEVVPAADGARGSDLPAQLPVRRPRRRPPRRDLRDEPGLGGGARRRSQRCRHDRATGAGRGLLLRGARRHGSRIGRPKARQGRGRERRLTAIEQRARPV